MAYNIICIPMLTLNKYILVEIREKKEQVKVCISIDQQSERSRSSQTSVVTFKLHQGHVILGSETVCIVSVGDERFTTTLNHALHFCLTQVVKTRIIEKSSSISSDIIYQVLLRK